MIIKTDNGISIEVHFDPLDRKDGFEDDIRFRIHEDCPREFKIFKADSTGFLLTAKQADQLAKDLKQAVSESNALPRNKTLKRIK